jgi:hypothetical protein
LLAQTGDGSRKQPYGKVKKLSVWAEETQINPNALKKIVSSQRQV